MLREFCSPFKIPMHIFGACLFFSWTIPTPENKLTKKFFFFFLARSIQSFAAIIPGALSPLLCELPRPCWCRSEGIIKAAESVITLFMSTANIITSVGNAGEQPPAWAGALLMAGWKTEPQRAQITHWQVLIHKHPSRCFQDCFPPPIYFPNGILPGCHHSLFYVTDPAQSCEFWHLKAGNWKCINLNSSLGAHACMYHFWNNTEPETFQPQSREMKDELHVPSRLCF